ncbi:MAG: hypothetical protein K2P51_09010 [Rhabdochlamydiaceae bacterium]|nr:hypothetical protein [Rhabdochlamydiaceae bacterium]
MELKGKALYNLLRISLQEDPSMEVKAWQVEDYRQLDEKSLFSRLSRLGIVLDEESFLVYAENCESPEELVECLCCDEENLELRDETFLIVCELWRRLLPDKPSLSLFCDELDQLFEQYDNGTMQDEESLQEALSDLEDILDLAVDHGTSPQEAFRDVSQYCAHDLEGFISDYIADLIETENDLAASELLDSFYEYIGNQKRFDFLRARIFAESDIAEGNLLIGRLLELLSEEPDLSLLLEMADYLVNRGDVHLFMQAVRQAIPLLQQEDDLQNLLRQIASYFRCLDREDEEKMVASLLDKRKHLKLDQQIDPSDMALNHIVQIFNHS